MSAARSPNSPSVLIVTAADAAYAPLLRDLVESLRPGARQAGYDLACFDLGLAPADLAWLHLQTERIVTPVWDLPVAPRLRAEQPQLRALTVRPFIPRYFPGYDLYLWLDADTWVQEWIVIGWYLRAAAGGSLAIAPQVDRAYVHRPEYHRWRHDRWRAYFGEEAAQRALFESVLNAGVFALKGDAPHWAMWEKWFTLGLERADGELCDDQAALNHAVRTEGLPLYPLPATCNWLCHLALPAWDARGGRLCEPLLPHQHLGVVHLTAGTKQFEFRLSSLTGGSVVKTLRYPAHPHSAIRGDRP